MLFIALAVIQLHALIPHTHSEEKGWEITQTSHDHHWIDLLAELWHPDIGEDHLNIFETVETISITGVFAMTGTLPFLIYPLETKHILPSDTGIQPLPLIPGHSLRAPPYFA